MKAILNRLFEYQNLSASEATELLLKTGRGEYNDAEIASLITAFQMRNISIDELLGFRTALLEMMIPVDLKGYRPIDIVGTGGDGKNTFNISTCACFVVAGAGFPVAKHGNGGASSVSGASNVLEYHRVRFSADNDRLMRSLDGCGVMYLHAPLFNKAMKRVAPIRKSLGMRSFFNILGPLVNPARPPYQLLGVYNLPMMRLYNYVYQRGETTYAIVHSLDGYDEISLTADFKVATSFEEQLYAPANFNLQKNRGEDLYGGSTIAEAANIFDAVLEGTSTPAQRNSVVINAAFAIRLIHPEKTIEACCALAEESIASGKALACFRRFLELNN